MAEQKKKDDLADALAALAAGHHEDEPQEGEHLDAEAHEPSDYHEPMPAAPVAPPRAAVPRPSPPKPTARPAPAGPAAPTPVARAPRPAGGAAPQPAGAPPKPVARPSIPIPKARPAAPAAPAAAAAPTPVARPRPAAPTAAPARPAAPPAATRPVAPTARPAVPVAPTARPAAPIARPASPVPPQPVSSPRPPTPAAEPEFIQDEAPPADEFVGGVDTGVEVSDGEWVGAAPTDDDAMLAPAPEASMLGHTPRRFPKSDPVLKSLEFKRTLIPILLTLGVLMLALGSFKYILGADSLFAILPGWVAAMVAATGVVLLGAAGMMMMSVKALLERKAAAPTQ